MIDDLAEENRRYQEEWQARSTEELIQALLADPDGAREEGFYTPLYELHQRGTQALFDRSRMLCQSGDPRERRVGADILGQLGSPDTTSFHEGAVQILLAMLEREEDPKVLSAIVMALGHRDDPRAIARLVRLKNHPDVQVRKGVAFGLIGYADERAIATLIELSRDTNNDVRQCAANGLGADLDSDNPAISAALFARLDDADEVVRGEALVGLARRHDERVLATIISDLKSGAWDTATLDAAMELGDPRLYPALLQVHAEWDADEDEDQNWPYTMLEEALAICQP